MGKAASKIDQQVEHAQKTGVLALQQLNLDQVHTHTQAERQMVERERERKRSPVGWGGRCPRRWRASRGCGR
jgi:hypothetical protein